MVAANLSEYLQQSRDLAAASASPEMSQCLETAVTAIAGSLKAGHTVLVAGNGGSASDAMHIAGELVGRFLKERPALRVIALSANPAVLTAWANDYDYRTVFSRQVEAYGDKGGVILGISTSGNSPNIVTALQAARTMGMTTIALTGEGGGACAAEADILLAVPSRSTPRIQEVHICLYHYLCERVEAALAP